MPAEELTPLAVELLEVPAELIQTALDLELAERTVIADTVGETACIFLAGLYRAEQVIAERILRLANGKLPWPYIDSERHCRGSSRRPVYRWPKVRSPRSDWPFCRRCSSLPAAPG